MTETSNEVPGINEPDPDNVRLRSFQGGSDGLPPMLDKAPQKATNQQGAGAGTSGLPPVPQAAPPVARKGT